MPKARSAIDRSESTDLDTLGDLGDGFTREKSEHRRRRRQPNLTASDVHHCRTLSLHETRAVAGGEVDTVSWRMMSADSRILSTASTT